MAGSHAIYLLGRPSVERNGIRQPSPHGRKAWALLAYLTATGSAPSRKWLAELLFSDAEDPLNALSWNLSQLRRPWPGRGDRRRPANNTAAQTSFIPLLTLGLPAHPVMALMVGAFIIQGITPGPNVIVDEPALSWGLVVSMWVGNLLLVMLNLPLIGIWVKMLTIPYNVLFPAIVAFAAIGTYSLNLNAFDVFAIAFFGLLGYFLIKLGCEPAPLLLGFILGPLLEQHLRRALIISRGDPMVFLTRPVSLALLVVAALAIVIAVLPSIRRKREVVFREEDAV